MNIEKKSESFPKGAAISFGVIIIAVIAVTIFALSKPTNTTIDANAKDVATNHPTTTTAKQLSTPVNLSGHGQQATGKFSLNEGLATFKLTHNGSHNFIVKLLDSQGNEVDYSLVNEEGNFDGSKAIKIPSDGQYLLDIQADGDWTVTIAQE